MTAAPGPDFHRMAALLRDLYLALRHVGFEERQALTICGQAVSAVPPTLAAPTVRLNVDDIAERARRRA